MEINAQTSQAALEELFRAVTRREMLSKTPLNIKLFLRYAVLFILFPGMVFGFWAGLGVTLLYCVALVCLMAYGMADQAALAVQVWLCVGCCVFVWVALGAIRAALALRKLRRTPIAAAEAQLSANPMPPCGKEHKLRWHKDEAAWLGEVAWSAPADGIYAVLLSVHHMGRRRLVTRGRQGVCAVYTATTPEGNLQALLLYKLSAGDHALRWVFYPASGAPPATSITLLAAPRS